MRFFYALIIFLISIYIFFWLFIFLIPTPQLILDEDIILAELPESNSENIRDAIQVIKSEDKKSLYFFEESIEEKKQNAVFLYIVLAFLLSFILIIVFHSKSYILFPIITSVVFVTFICSFVWMFTNSIDKNIYLDLQAIRDTYTGLKAFKYLSGFLFLQIFLLVFGYWYDIP